MQMKIAGAFLGIAVVAVLVNVFMSGRGGGLDSLLNASDLVEVKWEDLYKMDPDTGEVPEELAKLNGQRVKIAGFIVPLSDNIMVLDEFLLVPDAQSCIHVPPPPANLIVQSRLKKPVAAERVANPSWAIGTLRIERTESQYGAAGYQMEVDMLREYVF